MDKPKEKRMIGITAQRGERGESKKSRYIGFDCKYSNIVKQLKEFGHVESKAQGIAGRGYLVVDACYSYSEVLEYIKFLGKDKPEKKKADRRYAIGQAAYMCFSCKLTDCPYRWDKKMNINDPEFMTCPFRERQDT